MEKSGNEDLETEKAELEKNVESEAAKELEKEKEEERKAVEDQYGYGAQNHYEEDKVADRDDSDGDKRPTKGGKNDGGYFGSQNKDDSDDGMTSGAYAKPTRGGGKVRGARGGGRGGGKGFKFSDNDFPEL